MPVDRVRMRPWLEDKIESGSVTGLVWVDKEKGVFSIPWKHAARHGWEMNKDASLFMQWAIHTGKYKPGKSAPDPKTWKANFRCAMNSLADIEEVKGKSVNKGCGAVRVYRLLQAVKKKDRRSKMREVRKRAKGKTVKSEEMDTKAAADTDHGSSYTVLNDGNSSTQENTVDSTEDLESGSPFYYVPEWSQSVEIGPDSTNELYAFQVSPMRSEEEEDTAAIDYLMRLEPHAPWEQSNVNGKDFLNNEVGTSQTYPSPQSPWSDSSGDEPDVSLYTELTRFFPEMLNLSDFVNPSLNQPNVQPISCSF